MSLKFGNKFIWTTEIVKFYKVIGKYIEKQNKDDAIVIVGGGRLSSCCAEKALYENISQILAA